MGKVTPDPRPYLVITHLASNHGWRVQTAKSKSVAVGIKDAIFSVGLECQAGGGVVHCFPPHMVTSVVIKPEEAR